MDLQTNNVIVENSNDSNTIAQTFLRMFLGLLATAIMAFLSFENDLYLSIDYSVLALAELGVVVIFSLLFRKLPPIVVTILYYLYAILNGVTMGVIFAEYDIGTIAYAFLITSAMFGVLAILGFKTKVDVTKFSTILFVCLILGFITSLINLFIGNTIVEIILDWAMLVIFGGITVYDIYKIKHTPLVDEKTQEKLYVYYAMDLYLDFINMFIRLLSIMGRRRD